VIIGRHPICTYPICSKGPTGFTYGKVTTFDATRYSVVLDNAKRTALFVWDKARYDSEEIA